MDRKWNPRNYGNQSRGDGSPYNKRIKLDDSQNNENEEMNEKLENFLSAGDQMDNAQNRRMDGVRRDPAILAGEQRRTASENEIRLRMNEAAGNAIADVQRSYGFPANQVTSRSNNEMNGPEAALMRNKVEPPGKMNSPENATKLPVTGEEVLIALPPSKFGGEKITLYMKDIKKLDRKEYLNDSVVEFMVNFISSYRIKKELIPKIHMFNTFFYNSLSKEITPLGFSGRVKKNPNDQLNLIRNSEKILRWTRKVDLFEKDYIVIPINEDFHWMLVTVINPQGALIENGNEEKSHNEPKCYILFYDPLSGLDPTKRIHITHMVKEYLRTLWDGTKKVGTKFAGNVGYTFDENRVIGLRPKNAPIQNNFSDCGLYVLHFIEGLFCNVVHPVTVKDFPNFDYHTFWPEAEKMCELMRDKVYNLIKKTADRKARSRLEIYESEKKVGLDREGDLRKTRRHSAAPFGRTPRHPKYYRRFYSLCPQRVDKPLRMTLFSNPRELASLPLTQRVRRLALPHEKLLVPY